MEYQDKTTYWEQTTLSCGLMSYGISGQDHLLRADKCLLWFSVLWNTRTRLPIENRTFSCGLVSFGIPGQDHPLRTDNCLLWFSVLWNTRTRLLHWEQSWDGSLLWFSVLCRRSEQDYHDWEQSWDRPLLWTSFLQNTRKKKEIPLLVMVTRSLSSVV